MPWSNKNTELELRPLFLLTAISFALGQALMLWYNLTYHTGNDIYSTIAALVIAMVVSVLLSVTRISTDKISLYVVLAVAVIFLVELTHAFTNQQLGSRIIVTYLMLVSAVFGVFHYKQATCLAVAGFVAVSIAFLSKPQPDLPLLMHLLCVSLMIATMSLQGISVRRQKDAVANYQKQALTDSLTGLPNRRATWEKLEQLDAAFRASACRQDQSVASDDDTPVVPSYVIILIDLDHFKQVNDKYGHPAGDRVLQEVGSWLQLLAQNNGGMVGRWGGEEFLMVLPNTNARSGYFLAEQLEQPILLPDQLPTITLSGGAVVSDDCNNLNELLSVADHRLYTAKQGGRCQVRWSRRTAIDQLNDGLS